MDAGILRGLYTLFMFGAFVGIVWWAWSARRKSDFEEAAGLPLEGDATTNSGADDNAAQQGAKQ